MRPRQGQKVAFLPPGRGSRTAARLALLLLPLAAQAQFQSTRLAANHDASVVLFESTSPLRGQPSNTESILTLTPSQTTLELAGFAQAPSNGVAFPCVNDNGTVRAFTLTNPPFCGFGGCGLPPFIGIVRHATDQWDLRRPGRASLSREGRWAVFSSPSLARTTWIDLWTTRETTFPQAFDVSSVADDGTLVSPFGRTLVIASPDSEPRTLHLPFLATSALINRHATVAAVTSPEAIYRIDLRTGALDLWAPWDNARLMGLDAHGDTLLFIQWKALYTLKPGASPQSLSDLSIDSATLTGDDRAAIAASPTGLFRLPLDNQASPELLLSGPTTFPNAPTVLAPGLWLNLPGRGAANAQITLNGQPVDALSRSPSDLIWAIPNETPTGPAQLEIQQPNSPFEPFRLTLPVQLAAPHFLIQRDLNEGNESFADNPYIRHSATGLPVTWDDPARPNEAIDVLMTGLNHQGPAIQWSVNRHNQDDYVPLAFESETPHPENPHWNWVRLRLPAVLPGPNCWINAIYGASAHSAYFTTATPQ